MKTNGSRMHLVLCFLAAGAMTTRRSILYIQSTKDNKYLNLKGDFVDLEKIKSHFQTELETDKGTPPYMKIRDEKNRYLSVKDDTLWWTDEDLGFKWNSSFVETGEGMLSDQNGKCFAREASQVTLKNCSDIINDTEMSHFKLIFVPTEEEIKHACSVLEASKEQNRILSQEYDNARRGEERSPHYPPGMYGDSYNPCSHRNGIGDSLSRPMRGSIPDGGVGPESERRYSTEYMPKPSIESSSPLKKEGNVPSRGIEGIFQGNHHAEMPLKDRYSDSAVRSGTGRPPGREQGGAGDPYSAQDYSKAISIAKMYADEQAEQRTAPASRPGEHDGVSSDSIKALNDLKRMLGENQMEVSRMAEKQKEKMENDVSKKSVEVLDKLKEDISKLKKENEERLSSPATRSAADGGAAPGPLEEKHDDDHYKNVRKIKETLQNLQEQLGPLLQREASNTSMPSHGRRYG